MEETIEKETVEEEATEKEIAVEMVDVLEAGEATPESDFTWDGTTILTYIGSATEVVILDKAQKISSRAFFNNTTVESVTISENVTNLGERAFAGCSSLTKADGTGIAFADKSEVEKLSAVNGKTVTLYAQWTRQ